jgi:formate/nitrite transporter FocA (FNT family)
VYLCFSGRSVTDKILAILFPITAFVALGFEHSIANMFFIPLGIFYGAPVSWQQFLLVNLVPVTLGNIAGGSFFVGTIYWYVYEYQADKISKSKSGR